MKKQQKNSNKPRKKAKPHKKINDVEIFRLLR